MSDPHDIPIGRSVPHAMWRLSAASCLIASHLGVPLSVLLEQAADAARIVLEAWNKFLFRRFWGENVSSKDAYLVIESYENVVLRNRFRWADSGQERSDNFSGEVIQGTFSPQATAMLTAFFLRHTGKGLCFATGIEKVNLTGGALICYGSSDSNFKSFEIKPQSGGILCQFAFNERSERGFRLGDCIENRDGITYDKAILLRLTSQRDSGPCHVVCAGPSEWGSLAAVNYFTKQWKVLHEYFDHFVRQRDFGVLLEVPVGRFENARGLASAVWWQSNPAREMT